MAWVIIELDGKKRENFDLLDYFIADYGIVLKNAEKVMAMDSLVIAKKLVDINVTRDEILEITLSLTPAKMAEVIGKLSVLEMMMAVNKMRARKTGWWGQGWLHVKLLMGLLLLAYQFYCGALLRGFEEKRNTHSHKWYRVFNEVPVLMMVVVLYMVVFKPF